MELSSELHTKRLLLRPLCADDAIGLQRGLNNFNVTQFLARVPYPYTLGMAHEFIAKQGNEGQDFVRGICFACAPDEVLGVIAYERTEKGEFGLGYWLRECCWGMGVMSEAAQSVVQHYFLHGPGEKQCLYLQSSYWNPISGQLLRRLGFVEKGPSKMHSVAQGKLVESMEMELFAKPA